MNKLQKNFIYNIAYQILLVILPLITAPYISRTLGATSVGIYSYTNSVAYYFILVAMLGIGNHGNRSVAAAREDKDKLNHVFSSIFSLQVILFSIAVIAYTVYTFLLTDDNRVIVLLQLLYVASGLFDVNWLFFGLEEFKITVTRNVLIKFATVAFMFIFVHNPDDLWKYTLIMSAGTLLSQLYLWRYVNRYVKYVWVGFSDIFSNFKKVLILFIPVLAYSIYKVMDKIMLGNMVGYEQVAFYNNAEKIIGIPMGVITALGTVMLPRMSNIAARKEKDKSEKYIRLSIKFVTLTASAIAFGLMGVSSVLAPVFFGSEFTACSPIMQLLSVTVFFVSWANVMRTQYLIPNHFDNVYLISTMTGAVLNLAVNWICIPILQANGAAIGTIAAEFTVMIIQMLMVSKRLPVYKYIGMYIPIILIGFVMMCFVQFIGGILGVSLLTLIVQICSGGLLFAVLVFIYYLISKDEFGMIIFSMIKKIKR